MGVELLKLLKSKSILDTDVPLLEWFSKSVKTCPTVVGKIVRWNIHCYECDKIILKEVDNWGSMESKIYSDTICYDCHLKYLQDLAEQYKSIDQYEI